MKSLLLTCMWGGGKSLKCNEVESGLYLSQGKHNNNNNSQTVSVYSFLTLISTNKSNFTRHKVKMADETRELYGLLGFPGYKKIHKRTDEWMYTQLSDRGS